MTIEVSLLEAVRTAIAPRLPKFPGFLHGLVSSHRELTDAEKRQKSILDILTKARIMEKMIAEDVVESSRYPLVTSISQSIYHQFASGLDVEGVHNLEKAKEWAEKIGSGLTFTPRHESDFDTPALRYAFDKLGFSDISNNTLWVAGVNMEKRPYTRVFMDSEHRIYIATPYDLSEVQRLLAQDQLEVATRERLEIAQATFIEMNKIALKKARESAIRKENLMLYPEAGRSYDGLMKKAPGEVIVYFPRHNETVVVSCRQYGPKEINPPNRLIRLQKLIPGFRQRMRIKIGVPYLSSEIWEVWKIRRKEDHTANPMDWVMANLANVDPSDIRQEELAHYKGLMERFKPERVSEALAMAA